MDRRIRTTSFVLFVMVLLLTLPFAFAGDYVQTDIASTASGTVYSSSGNFSSTESLAGHMFSYTNSTSTELLYGYIYSRGEYFSVQRASTQVAAGKNFPLSWTNNDGLSGTFYVALKSTGGHNGQVYASAWSNTK